MRVLTLSFFLSVVFSTCVYAQSRVVGNKSIDPAIRCAGKGIAQSTCEERRKYALENVSQKRSITILRDSDLILCVIHLKEKG